MLSPGQIAPPIRHVVRRYKNVRGRAGRGDRLRSRPPDRPRHDAVDQQHLELPYDSLIVAAGVDAVVLRPRRAGPLRARHEDDRRRPGAPPADLRRVRDGRGRRPTRSSGSGGSRSSSSAPARRVSSWPGRSASSRSAASKGEFRTFDPASVRVLLLDGGKEPLATFGDRLSGKAGKELERLGVELRMDARVVGVDADGVDVVGADGGRSRIEACTTIWAAGVAGVAAGRRAGRGERRRRSTGPGASRCCPTSPCRVTREVFAIGDMATVNHLPGVAEVAMQGGLHAANTILRRTARARTPSRSSTATSAAWRRSGASAPSPASASSASAGSPAGSCGSSSTSPS